MPSSRVWRAAIIAAAMCAAAVLYTAKVSSKMPDFEVFWRAGVRAAAGESLYRPEDGHYQFKYLPAFAVMMSAFSRLPADAARATWFAVSGASLVALMVFSLRLWPARGLSCWVVVALTLVVLGKFYARELLLGQANAMFGAVIAGAVLALSRGRERLGGVLIALGIVLKPYGLIFVPWLVARRRVGSSGMLALGIASALGAPVLLYSVSDTIALHGDWWRTVRDTTSPNLLNPDNVSWMAMYTKWSGGLDARWPARLSLLTALAVLGSSIWIWRERVRVSSPDGLEGALLLLLVPLISPQGWDYVLLLATPAVVCLLLHAERLQVWLRVPVFVALAVIGLTLYDVMGRTAYNAFMMASGVTLCTFLIIAGLFTLRVRGRAA